MKKCQARKGFTLVELAVVIAIVAILAAVAIPRLMDSSDAAEESVARDFASQLMSAASMWTAANSRTPTGFNEFVKSTALTAGDGFAISTANLGPNAGSCTVSATTINCTAAFNRLSNATYTWSDGGVVATIAQ